MDDATKMLRAIINGQVSLKQELLKKIEGVDKKVGNIDSKIDGVEKRLTQRIDKLGRQIAYVEDDAPTQEEFDDLVSRVDKVEIKLAPSL